MDCEAASRIGGVDEQVNGERDRIPADRGYSSREPFIKVPATYIIHTHTCPGPGRVNVHVTRERARIAKHGARNNRRNEKAIQRRREKEDREGRVEKRKRQRVRERERERERWRWRSRKSEWERQGTAECLFVSVTLLFSRLQRKLE